MIRHLAGVAEIVEDVEAAVNFYRDVLGLAVKYEEGADYAEIEIAGILHYGIWSREAAAKATYGDPGAVELIKPGFSVGFEVDSVDKASQRIKNKWELAQPTKTEPWGQRTARFMTPSGMLAEVSETPGARLTTGKLEGKGEREAGGDIETP